MEWILNNTFCLYVWFFLFIVMYSAIMSNDENGEPNEWNAMAVSLLIFISSFAMSSIIFGYTTGNTFARWLFVIPFIILFFHAMYYLVMLIDFIYSRFFDKSVIDEKKKIKLKELDEDLKDSFEKSSKILFIWREIIRLTDQIKELRK